MIPAYWGIEFIKVLVAYLLFMYAWPSLVFHEYLEGKGAAFRFCFCSAFQAVAPATAVILIELMRIPHVHNLLFRLVFYGAPLFTAVHYIGTHDFFPEKDGLRDRLRGFFSSTRSDLLEIAVIAILLISGTAYFSYGRLLIQNFSFSDIVVHHYWIYEMVNGRIFPAGIYPAGMHGFIYALRVLFGVNTYSLLLFVPGIHVSALLLAAYFFLRKLFMCRFSALMAVALFLTLDVRNGIAYNGINRLQDALPEEFGLYLVFICALSLINFLRKDPHSRERLEEPAAFLNMGSADSALKRGESDRGLNVSGSGGGSNDGDSGGGSKNGGSSDRLKRAGKRGPLTQGGIRDLLQSIRKRLFLIDRDLVLFTLSLAGLVAVHFFTLIIAFLVCFGAAISYLPRLVSARRFKGLMISVVIGCLVSALPMCLAYASGIKAQGSLRWGMRVIRGDDKDSEKEALKKAAAKPDRSFSKVIQTIKDLGYGRIYGQSRGTVLWGFACFGLLAGLIGLLAMRIRDRAGKGETREYGYHALSIISFVLILACVLPDLSLPNLVPSYRLFPAMHVIMSAVYLIPIDLLLSFLERAVGKVAVAVCMTLGVLFLPAFARGFGAYRKYLCYGIVPRYNAEIDATNAIIGGHKRNSCTFVSTTDSLYQIAGRDYHEEAGLFFKKACFKEREGEPYRIPTEYVYIFVEKRPLLYVQQFYLSGPDWFAASALGSNTEPIRGDIEVDTGLSSGQVYSAEIRGIYMDLDYRTFMERSLRDWCERFRDKHPDAMKVYYEDDDIICYSIKQDVNRPFDLRM